MSSGRRTLSSGAKSGHRPAEESHPYKAVYVLLCSFKDDDLGVKNELERLHEVFSHEYGFQVQHLLIPSDEPDEEFGKAFTSFVDKYQSQETLLIVYYGGHGELNGSQLAQWHCNQNSDHPVKWYGHQRVLENSTADALLILDCCQPVGGGGSVRRGTKKEFLAAAGFNRPTPAAGEHSFTLALCEQLKKMSAKPFSTAELYNQIVQTLRTRAPGHSENPVNGVMGEGGERVDSIRLLSYTKFPMNLIAVMGATGSGKSSLINRICGREVVDAAAGLESITKQVTHHVTVVNGETVTLIDTPGFSDTYLSDGEILRRISVNLKIYYDEGRKLTGLLFLRDINLPRMTNSECSNLELFHQVCGDESLKNVVLLTTKWDRADTPVAQRHEEELRKNFWSSMIGLGCSLPKRLGGPASQSSGIVDPVSDVIVPMLKYQPLWLQIQRQLGEGKLLSDTTAGQKINKTSSSNEEGAAESYKEAMIQSEKSREATIKAALLNQAEGYSKKIKEYQKEREALQVTCEKLMEESKEQLTKARDEVRRWEEKAQGLEEEAQRREMDKIRCTKEEKEKREREEKEWNEWKDKMLGYGVTAGGVLIGCRYWLFA